MKSFVEEEQTWFNSTRLSVRYIKPLDLPTKVNVEDSDTLDIFI